MPAGYGLQDVLAWLVVAGAIGYLLRRLRPRRPRLRPDVPLQRLTRKGASRHPSQRPAGGRRCH